MPKNKPVFAPATFSEQVFTEEAKKQFDEFPGWERHFVKRLLDHGDLAQAAKEAGISRHVKDNVDLKLPEYGSIREALMTHGIDHLEYISHLKDCLKAEKVSVDKGGNPIITTDLNIKLKTLELIAKLAGFFEPSKKPQNNAAIEELFES